MFETLGQFAIVPLPEYILLQSEGVWSIYLKLNLEQDAKLQDKNPEARKGGGLFLRDNTKRYSGFRQTHTDRIVRLLPSSG